MKVDRASDIFYTCGAPESGKSHELKRRLEAMAPARAIVVDPDGEYEGWGYLHEQLPDVLAATAYPTFRTRFRPSHVRAIAEKQFGFICELVRWHADPQPGQAAPPRVGPVVLVVDELADLVGSSFRETPDSWQWIVRRGRKYGVALLAASQRPAQIDKTLFDLASCIRIHRLNNPDSMDVCAKAVDVPVDELRRLIGHEFRERNKRTGELLGRPAAAAAPPAARAAAPGAPGRPGARAARAAPRATVKKTTDRAKR